MEGEIQFYQCVYEQRYDQLTNYINAGEGIDFSMPVILM